MNPDEYANLALIEQTHWYYAGKRALVRYWLTATASVKSEEVLLDCGAGTGLFAKEMESLCRVFVLDNHEEALRYLRTRFQPGQIISLAGNDVPLPDNSLDYVTALDVLEHVPDDASVVQTFRRLLKPGGLAVVTVPASMALWGDWDEALHHFRRYNKEQLAELFPGSEWSICHLNYTNVAAYPVVWCLRKLRRLRKPSTGMPPIRSEDKIPPAPLNAALKGIFVSLGRVRIPFPFGVSLILVARKK